MPSADAAGSPPRPIDVAPVCLARTKSRRQIAAEGRQARHLPQWSARAGRGEGPGDQEAADERPRHPRWLLADGYHFNSAEPKKNLAARIYRLNGVKQVSAGLFAASLILRRRSRIPFCLRSVVRTARRKAGFFVPGELVGKHLEAKAAPSPVKPSKVY